MGQLCAPAPRHFLPLGVLSLPFTPQRGEGTPQVTGFFEVMVAGKLVHSKKVRLLPAHASHAHLPPPVWGWHWGPS